MYEEKILEIGKESEVMNNKNTHAYMQAAVNVMFTYMNAKKGINIFYERCISAMIKQFKLLDEGEMT